MKGDASVSLFLFYKRKRQYYINMIYLTKDTATEVIVTFGELATLTPVYYLIVVEDAHGEVVEYITPTDTSTSTERYNEFEITTALPAAEYKYKAYESSTLNPTINDVVGEPLEYGLVVVHSTDEVEDSVYL